MSSTLPAHWSPSELDSVAVDSRHYQLNTSLGETAGLLRVNTGGTHSNHCVSEGERLWYKFLLLQWASTIVMPSVTA